MPAKRPVRSNTPAKSSKSPESAASKTFSDVAGKSGAVAAIAFLAICIVTAAIVMAVRDASHPVEVSAADAHAATVAAESTRRDAPPVAKVKAPVATEKTRAAETAAKRSSDTSAPKAPTTLSATVTVAGCLERADNGFRLKDTSGADAPRSRSWKSGFFKKSPASIQLVDAANGLRLADHVGRRVSVTGTLIDREMRAHSLQRVQGGCK